MQNEPWMGKVLQLISSELKVPKETMATPPPIQIQIEHQNYKSKWDKFFQTYFIISEHFHHHRHRRNEKQLQCKKSGCLDT